MGDAACWLHAICPDCGQVVDGEHVAHRCPRRVSAATPEPATALRDEGGTSVRPMDDVIAWLLDEEADPAIRWQVRRDLLGAPPSVWEAERAAVEHRGWGAQLLAHQDEDGQWAGGAFFPADFVWGGDEVGQPWTATAWVLADLRELGIDPSASRLQRTVEQLRTTARWEHDDQPFWEGEVEPCINGRTVAFGAYYGVDVDGIVERLVEERLADGGWNCEVENGATVSSIDTTINVVEGLLEHERATGGTAASREARRTGEEYLLQRGLFRRRSTGEVIDEFTELKHPHRWHHDVLRGLDHFRAASELTGTAPDPRLAEAIELVRGKRRGDGRWAADLEWPGRRWVDLDPPPGEPSRWLTLKALRVLQWWDGAI